MRSLRDVRREQSLAVGLPLAASGALKGLKSSAATFIRFISAGVFRYVDHRTVNFWGVILMGVSTLLIPVLPTFGVLVVLFAINGVCRGLLRVTSSAICVSHIIVLVVEINRHQHPRVCGALKALVLLCMGAAVAGVSARRGVVLECKNEAHL